MKYLIRTIIISAFICSPGELWSAKAAEPSSQTAAFERMGLYVVSSDLPRSRSFYGKVFGTEPELVTDALIGFNVAGGMFAIVSKAVYAQNSTIGDNVVPYIQVRDIDALLAHLQTTVPDAVRNQSIIDESVIKILKCQDPDGNLVEFYWLAD